MTARERPILFSAPMVRAIFAGTKTQTRRIVGIDTLRPSDTRGYDWTWRGRAPIRSIAQQRRYPSGCWQDVQHEGLVALCPHGAPGDRLWVRETWAPFVAPDGSEREGVAYRATCADDGSFTWVGDDGDGSLSLAEMQVRRWRPAIHMPRWASRIVLEITDVRVERLQAITEADARAEGLTAGMNAHSFWTARGAFQQLWDSLNARAAPWASNPWVWAITFRRVQPAKAEAWAEIEGSTDERDAGSR